MEGGNPGVFWDSGNGPVSEGGRAVKHADRSEGRGYFFFPLVTEFSGFSGRNQCHAVCDCGARKVGAWWGPWPGGSHCVLGSFSHSKTSEGLIRCFVPNNVCCCLEGRRSNHGGTWSSGNMSAFCMVLRTAYCVYLYGRGCSKCPGGAVQVSQRKTACFLGPKPVTKLVPLRAGMGGLGLIPGELVRPYE